MNEQVQSLLKQVSITQRIGIIGAALASVAMIAVLVMFASKPDFTPAFTNLSAADATTIEEALRTANIPYQVADAGTTIEVPVESLGDARIAAGTAGVTSGAAGNDTKGWALFDNQGFGQSAFDQNITYQRALEGELTKTIQGMNGVASARVSIVLAQTGALSSQDTPASAAVVLAMTGGVTPSSNLVQAIVNTVSRSVQGLKTDNVVVTDDQGHTLAGSTSSIDSTAAQAKGLVEQQTMSKIDTLLEAALGANHASVAVSADVDTSQVEQNVTTYAATGSNPPVSIHQIIEAYGATASGNACGIPGTNTNVAGVPSYPGVCEKASTTATPTATPTPAPSASASASAAPSASPSAGSSATAAPAATASPDSASAYTHVETTVNYSNSTTIAHIVTQPGVVKKLSVAVLVDQTAMGTLTADVLKTSIAAAIGADETRGDVVSVQAITFAAQPSGALSPAASAASAAAAAAANPDVMKTVSGMSSTIIGAGFALVMLLLFWLNMGALRRKADENVYDLGPGGQPSFAPVPNRAGIPANTDAGAPAAADVPSATPQARIQERLRMVADERPDALVGLMHGWLREEGRNR
jgi:flagellar M-ring protein FliF